MRIADLTPDSRRRLDDFLEHGPKPVVTLEEQVQTWGTSAEDQARMQAFLRDAEEG
jgi:hypothetical protein